MARAPADARERFEVVLVQMPFAPLKQAPLALLQLQAALERALGGLVTTRIVYPSHDFGTRLGLRLYHQIAYVDSSLRSGEMSGLGDWFFREAAFPTAADNTADYRARYFPEDSADRFIDFDEVLAWRARATSMLEDIIEKYALDSAGLVGLTSMFAQHAASIALARLLKQSANAPLVVIGGANCEGPMGQALADAVPYFDAVFSGPGLVSFPAYVRACLSGDDARVPDIRGVLRKRQAAEGLEAPKAAHESVGEELDINAPLRLDYDAFLEAFEHAFAGTLEPVLTFETSRGCWWGARAHCPFCGLNGSTMAYRAMRPPNAVALFERLFQYVPRTRVFECVDNIMPAEYPATVFPSVTPPPGVAVYYEVKADLSAGQLASMTRAGIRLIQPGIEALSTPSLKALRKGTTAAGNILLLKYCLGYGVAPIWNLLIGIPLEDRPEDIYAKYADDIPRLAHLPPPWAVFTVRIDRFSPYFTRPGDYGLSLRPKAFYSFVYPFDARILSDLAYYFDDANAGEAPYARAAAAWHPILHERVRAWRDAWQARDASARPALFLQECAGAHRLHDSRGGRQTDEIVAPPVARALALSSMPTRVSRLCERLEQEGYTGTDGILAELRERELLFEEDDRLIGLVHLGPPPRWPSLPGGV